MTKRISDWRDRPWDSPWTGDPVTIAAADAVTEIGLSRSMCYGSCPVYSVSLRRSGEARFEGEHFVDLLGTHIAQIEPGDFEVLALAVAHLGFDALAPDYTVAITCQPTTTTWLVRGDVRQEVSDDGNDAAVALDTAGLTARERRLLQLRFGLEDGRARTLEEVGEEFKMTPARIRQIEANALRKLRSTRPSSRTVGDDSA